MTEFLYRCAEVSGTLRTPLTTSNEGGGANTAGGGARKSSHPITLFSSGHTRAEVAVQLMLKSHDILEGFDLAQEVMTVRTVFLLHVHVCHLYYLCPSFSPLPSTSPHPLTSSSPPPSPLPSHLPPLLLLPLPQAYRLPPSNILSETSQGLAAARRYNDVRVLLDCLSKSSFASNTLHDEILMAAIREIASHTKEVCMHKAAHIITYSQGKAAQRKPENVIFREKRAASGGIEHTTLCSGALVISHM